MAFPEVVKESVRPRKHEWGEEAEGRGNSIHKGPEAGMCLVHSRRSVWLEGREARMGEVGGPLRALWAKVFDFILNSEKLPGDFSQKSDFPLAARGK